MIVFFLLTMFVVVIPALHVLNKRYVQSIALFFGSAQLALLAFGGKIDDELSGILVNAFNQVVSLTVSVVVHKISLFVA